jgi:hypothetical protein
MIALLTAKLHTDVPLMRMPAGNVGLCRSAAGLRAKEKALTLARSHISPTSSRHLPGGEGAVLAVLPRLIGARLATYRYPL